MLIEPEIITPEVVTSFHPERKKLTVQELVLRSEKVNRAYDYAKEAHKDHYRLSGEPYLHHLEATTNILMGEWLDPQEIDDYIEDLACAGLLHDSVEDVGVSLSEIKERFGERVATYVEGVRLLRSDKSKEEQDRENLKFVAEKGSSLPYAISIRLWEGLRSRH